MLLNKPYILTTNQSTKCSKVRSIFKEPLLFKHLFLIVLLHKVIRLSSSYLIVSKQFIISISWGCEEEHTDQQYCWDFHNLHNNLWNCKSEFILNTINLPLMQSKLLKGIKMQASNPKQKTNFLYWRDDLMEPLCLKFANLLRDWLHSTREVGWGTNMQLE